MSGIYGILRFDQTPVADDWLEKMRFAMAYYGPDGAGSRIEGSLGLGHLLLSICPEDRFENQPIERERGLVVTAARLDNRTELLEALRVPEPEAAKTSDAKLVGRAFDRWGEEDPRFI